MGPMTPLVPRNKQKKQCPHCGAMKIGLKDHIRAKHPQQAGVRPLPPQAPWSHSPTRFKAWYWKRTLPQVPPLECPDCGADMVLRESEHGYFYGCTNWSKTGCKGSHSADENGMPFGIPADAHTRKLRKAA